MAPLLWNNHRVSWLTKSQATYIFFYLFNPGSFIHTNLHQHSLNAEAKLFGLRVSRIPVCAVVARKSANLEVRGSSPTWVIFVLTINSIDFPNPASFKKLIVDVLRTSMAMGLKKWHELRASISQNTKQRFEGGLQRIISHVCCKIYFICSLLEKSRSLYT